MRPASRHGLCTRIELLFAVDLEGGNGRLPFARDNPIDECLTFFGFDVGVLGRIHKYDAIGIMQRRVALDRDLQTAPVFERSPGNRDGADRGAGDREAVLEPLFVTDANPAPY